MALDWTNLVAKYNALGIWHAVQYLKAISFVKDPFELAHDVVQDAWIKMWERQQFTKGLFITIVIGLSQNAARDCRPVELIYKRKNGSRIDKMTSVFPVQIFAVTLDEVTFEINTPSCGDE